MRQILSHSAILITVLLVSGVAKGLTPPTQYVCNPDKIGNCVCTQNETNQFPKSIQPGILCDHQKDLVLHGDYVTLRPSDGRTSVSYTINGDRQMMLVNSLNGMDPVLNRYWEKSDSVWVCQDAALCQLSRK